MIRRSFGNRSIARCAPTPLAPIPSGLLVEAIRVDAAEELAVAADVADGVDAGRAVLAAPVHHLGGERQVSVEALVTGVRVRSLQLRTHRRGFTPAIGDVISQVCERSTSRAFLMT